MSAPQLLACNTRSVDQSASAVFGARNLISRPTGTPTRTLANYGHGWLQQRNRSRAQFRERRIQKSHLAHPWLLDKQLNQCAKWPPTAGQLGRQGRVAGVDGPAVHVRELRPAPQRWG